MDRQERHQGREGRRRRPAALARVGRDADKRQAVDITADSVIPVGRSTAKEPRQHRRAREPEPAAAARRAPAARPTAGRAAALAGHDDHGDDTASATSHAPAAAGPRDARHRALPAALFGREDRRAYIEVRYRHRDDMRRHFFAHTDTFAAARTIARLGLSSDVYVGVAPRRHDDAGGKDAIDRVWTLWADIDTPDAHDALRKASRSRRRSSSRRAPPGHLHAYWPLARPVSITAAETANRRLAATARRRRRRGHERRDDPAAARHLLLQDHASDTGRARSASTRQLTTLEPSPTRIAADPAPPTPTHAPSRGAGTAPRAATRCARWTRRTTSAPHRASGRALAQDQLPVSRRPHPEPARLRTSRRRLVLLRLQTPRSHRLRPRQLLWELDTRGASSSSCAPASTSCCCPDRRPPRRGGRR